MKTKYQVELVINEPEKVSVEELLELTSELENKIHAIRFHNKAAAFGLIQIAI